MLVGPDVLLQIYRPSKLFWAQVTFVLFNASAVHYMSCLGKLLITIAAWVILNTVVVHDVLFQTSELRKFLRAQTTFVLFCLDGNHMSCQIRWIDKLLVTIFTFVILATIVGHNVPLQLFIPEKSHWTQETSVLEPSELISFFPTIPLSEPLNDNCVSM